MMMAAITTTAGMPMMRPLPSQVSQLLLTGTEQIGGTAGHAIHAERANEGWHAQAGDQHAVDPSRHHGGAKCNDDTRDKPDAGPCRGADTVRDLGRDDGGETHGEADRQIDAARDNDQRLAEAEQHGCDGKDRDGADIEGAEEEGAAIGDLRPDLKDDQQQNEKDPGPRGGQRGQGAAAPGRARCRAQGSGRAHAE
jgi:hypothetical protein